MIGNIAKSGSNFQNALSYCKYERKVVDEDGNLKVRGELVYFQNVEALELYGPDIKLKEISAELEEVAEKNTRTIKPVSHVSFSFPPGESPSNEVLQGIVKDYAKEFGLKDNGLLAYKHVDKEHEHIHIIANKINEDGKNTVSTSYNFLDMGHFSRKMENKYNLQSTKQMDSLKIDGKGMKKSNPVHEQLRNHIDKMIPESKDLDTLRVSLLKKGFKTKVGNGITFIQKSSGVIIKGSDLGREYSKANLEKRINGTYETDEKFGLDNPKTTEKDKLRELIKNVAPTSKTFPDFVASLKKEGYDVRTKDMINKKSGKPFTSILFAKDFGQIEKNGDNSISKNQKMITGSQLGPEFKFAVINGNINKGKWDDLGHRSIFGSKTESSSASKMANEKTSATNTIPSDFANKTTASSTVQKPKDKSSSSESSSSESSGSSGLDFSIERLLTSVNAGQIDADAAKSRAKIAAEIKRNAAGYANEFGSRGIEEMKEEKRKILRAQSKKKKRSLK
ncbi:hypothetical protein Dfri01_59550 [Dyadobacter frigoris]|uniref:relaxase/mobilization nuclease domain-containing protein n=1 Tax=Dyadobacter frigoris TaxID=2576211 RepID=UPI0024A2CFA9|nr:relaxase/mobilization nuclease domain-containing protein [Dyadobacter frigoris]GLU56494.1 hypothetical protein Dfri01_59550 [Dyadobacter frigoris]